MTTEKNIHSQTNAEKTYVLTADEMREEFRRAQDDYMKVERTRNKIMNELLETHSAILNEDTAYLNEIEARLNKQAEILNKKQVALNKREDLLNKKEVLLDEMESIYRRIDDLEALLS